MPLIPLGTYLVLEGSEHYGSFRGKHISWSWKSLLIGYFRGWVGFAAVFFFAGVGMATPMFLGVKGRQPDPAAVFGFFAGFFGGGAAALFVLLAKRRTWIFVELLLHVASAVIWVLAAEAAKPHLPPHQRIDSPEDLILIPCANLLLLAYSLTRLCDYADYDRVIQLGAELGLPTDIIEGLLSGQVDAQTLKSAVCLKARHQRRTSDAFEISEILWRQINDQTSTQLSTPRQLPVSQLRQSRAQAGQGCRCLGVYRRPCLPTMWYALYNSNTCLARIVFALIGLGLLILDVALGIAQLADDPPQPLRFLYALAAGVVICGGFLYKAITTE